MLQSNQKLTKQEFLEKLNNNQLVLSIIGMSNIGKSYWARRLSGVGFEYINCEGIIETKLREKSFEIKNHGPAGLAEWMGYPHEERFSKTQAEYLNTEKEVMLEIIDDLEREVSGNIAIDTTGSFIYTGEEAYKGIREKSLIIYIKEPEGRKKKMFEKFIDSPKAVIWGDTYSKREDESEMEALARCYPDLLDYRSKVYEKYADISIPFESIYKKVNANGFLELIKNQL